MSLKKRTKEEIEAIVKDFGDDLSLHEIATKYSISEDAIYRIIQKHHGSYVDRKGEAKSKVKRLEKELAEREKEIAILKAALKKY